MATCQNYGTSQKGLLKYTSMGILNEGMVGLTTTYGQ